MAASHFILTPVGSSGDVNPYVGLGRTLRARGYDVTLITADPFRSLVERAGLEFVPLRCSDAFEELAEQPDLWHPRHGTRLILEVSGRSIALEYERLADHFRPGASMLVGHALAFATRVFEDAHKAPAASIQLAPSLFRSNYRPPAYVPGRDFAGAPRVVKRLLWWLIDRLALDPPLAPHVNRLRRSLKLPRVSRLFDGWIHSPQRVIGMFPDWFAPPQPDWPPQLRLTGFPLYDEDDDHPVSPELEAFLAAGSPPIVFTPGSANKSAAAFFREAVDASQRLGRRTLLLTRHAGQLPADLPGSVRHESYVPLSTLLPRCAAIVHHGGIGTSSQGLAAGVPQLTMPLGFDQPDNATRLWRLGVSRWIAPSRFTGPRVASMLKELLDDPRVLAACKRHAQRVRSTNAREETCDLLEEI